MFKHPKKYDVIVVGGGHAGVEAALAAARMGCQTLLLSANLDSIGQMSCNPAIGGLAKGHLVREIDALGGEMGKATDMTGLQFRLLNTRKGPSVWAPRAQCDKKAYQFRLKWVCERQPNLDCKQGLSTSILHKDGVAYGIQTSLEVQYLGKCIIITTGTFLRALLHIGENQQAGGRSGEPAAMNLSDSLIQIGLKLGRLKTGTPPRLLKRSINFEKTQIQDGDNPIPYFSYWQEELFHVERRGTKNVPSGNLNPDYPPKSILEQSGGQLSCFITHTTDKTAQIIQSNLHRSPMYSGQIAGVGPRYCPSIEDKVIRFADKPTHQVFLEPEGIATDEIYVNGLSTSLPYEVQIQIVQSVVGCEEAEIIRPAYAVEYDFAFPTQILPTLETKACQNLYLAGQINGTSGYEEAAAQGLMAGINAANRVRGKDGITLRRDQAYIGVLIDDLVTKGTSEPYRMFTSRAEYRLLLRQDNADARLTDIGYELGLLSHENYLRYQKKWSNIRDEIGRLESTRDGSTTLAQILKRPEIHYHDLPSKNVELSSTEISQVEIEIKYAGYVARQELDVARSKSIESKSIPLWFDYDKIPSLRCEARQKLREIRPATLGQASRISGVSPSDISILSVFLKRGPDQEPTP